LARIALENGDDRSAATEYRASITNIERVQAVLVSELQTHFLGDKLAVYHEAIDLSLKHGQVHRAFEYLERANRERWSTISPVTRMSVCDRADARIRS